MITKFITIWKYIQLNRNFNTMVFPSYIKQGYLDPYGMSKGGILEINFTGDNIAGVLLYSSKWNTQLGPTELCGPDIVDFPDNKIFNTENKSFFIKYEKSRTVVPLIVNCNHGRLVVSYRYTNPINVDNNLLWIPICLTPFILIYVYLFRSYYKYKNIQIIRQSTLLKLISLIIFSIIWSSSWIIENVCKYLEHIYPLGNAVSLFVFIHLFYEKNMVQT